MASLLRSFLLLSLLSVSLGFLLDRENPPDDYDHDTYCMHFKKTYKDAPEKARRAEIFKENMQRIRAQNSLVGSTWKAGVNEFTDWSNDEFKAKRTGTTKHSAMKLWGASTPDLTGSPEVVLTDSLHHDTTFSDVQTLPESVDWRTKKNVVTDPKNQGGCGSCWAFSATETLESHVAIATGTLLKLSPQQIVSCTPNPDSCGGTGGCQGATQQLGFNYTMGAGITTEANYPYQGTTGTCDTSKIKPAAGIKGYVTLPVNNYTALASAIATKGPIAITVAAGGFGWQMYSSGVYSGGLFGCGFSLDHGVQVVGYGTDSGKGYWWVRNSWGGSWGLSGYMKLARFGEGKEPCGVDKAPADGIACKGNTTQVTYCGECGILSSSSYPTGAHLVSSN